MLTPQQYQQTEADTALADQAAQRMRSGTGTLQELLALRPALQAIYDRRVALHGWRRVAAIRVTLRKVAQLQTAVEEGTLNPQAHCRQLLRLGVFTNFVRDYDAALAIVRQTLTEQPPSAGGTHSEEL